MSRVSGDQYKDGKLINGYDYINQTWVSDGVYQRCGHPESMDCACYGRLHAGEEVAAGDRSCLFPLGRRK